MNRFLILLGIAIASAYPGCRAAQLQEDQDRFRHQLLDLQTNQIMDNLVRAYNGMPLLHVDYKSITGELKQNVAGEVDGAHTFLGAISGAINWKAGAAQDKTLSVTGEPVYTQNEVYDAYLQFVYNPEKPDRFLVTTNCPPPGAAHIVRQCGELYYWIPVEYKRDFLQLSLVTTVQRGQPLEIPRTFTNSVVGVSDPECGEDQFESACKVVLTFEKKIPNDLGTITFPDLEKTFNLVLINPAVAKGEDTDHLSMTFDFKKLGLNAAGEIKKMLKDQVVTIKLESHQPGVPRTQEILESVGRDVRLLRIRTR